jgi:hypothetical protein
MSNFRESGQASNVAIRDCLHASGFFSFANANPLSRLGVRLPLPPTPLHQRQAYQQQRERAW